MHRLISMRQSNERAGYRKRLRVASGLISAPKGDGLADVCHSFTQGIEAFRMFPRGVVRCAAHETLGPLK